MRKFISISTCLLLAFVMCFGLTACGEKEADAPGEAVLGELTPDPENTLSSFALTEGEKDGKVNFTEMDETVKCTVWDPESSEFAESEYSSDAIRGNYVRLIDNDKNKKADTVEIVAFENGKDYWDPDMAWAKDAGANMEPAVDDETGMKLYSDESTLPYGERLLSGGLEGLGGTNDFYNQEKIKYFYDNDYFNTLSSENLTILPGYRTYLQPDGWSCGCCSALCMLDWYGLRQDLNHLDLGMLRDSPKLEMGTELAFAKNIFKNLTDLEITKKWEVTTSDEEPDKLMDPEWMQKQLKAGHPIMVMWNSSGWHWQTIIGYDNMGTEDTNDDVLIMMDSYDTTDQDNDGYYIESYERLAYGTCTFPDGKVTGTQYLVAVPEGWKYEQKMGEGIAANKDNKGDFSNDMKMSYGDAAKDLKEYYPDTEDLGDNGLAAAAAGGYERSGDHKDSPYYEHRDFYNMKDSDSLHALTNFKTYQQTTEWTCGTASALMVANFFGKAEKETDVSLGHVRQNGEEGATYLDGMKEVFKHMNEEYGQDWVWVSTTDLDDPDGEESYIGDYCLQAGTHEEWYGLIPYLLDNDIPIMVGWDEWGGHWQVIVGYDDLGTKDNTQDDVVILADPYDTTDHNQDGYYVDGFERLVYGWYSSFEDKYRHNDFIAAFPKEGHEEVIKTLGAANN